MSYDEDEELETGFKMNVGEDETSEPPLDMPEEIPEIEDDPDDKYH